MPKCTINNVSVEVPEGTSIISAFKTLNKDIAHYCWHPGLSVAGVCRLCMVEIEGIPKLQIACNTEVKEGMKISNQSEKVKAAVRWGLEFHLINHPLDCPICDQAGECELQEQYMKFGKYTPGMAERKVKKRKVISLGSKVILDSERCILCSRCVRFTDEISRTHELGIFNRGDRSEIGVFKDKPLENNYSLNTVDICPVGALTAKNFRFKQRVWYLKTAESICTGCSTGCNIYLDYNEEGVFRARPRYNENINKHWMCDEGRPVCNIPNKKGRLLQPVIPPHQNQSSNTFFSTTETLKKLRKQFILTKTDKDTSALVLTAQYTVEEYESIVSFFLKNLGSQGSIYYWKNNPDTFHNFDNILLRGDKNPNTKGLLKVLKKMNALNHWEQLETQLENKKVQTLWVAGPENQLVYPDLKEKIQLFESFCQNIIWWTAHSLPVNNKNIYWQIPTKTFFEKTGTFVNFSGQSQKIKAVQTLVPSALSLSESTSVLGGDTLNTTPHFLKDLKTNHFISHKRSL